MVAVIGITFWRCSLGIDGLAEAERRLCLNLAETDQSIEAARNGSYRLIADVALDNSPVQWSMWYEKVAALTLPDAVFGNRFPTVFEHIGKPLSGEIAEPIPRSRDELADMVERFWMSVAPTLLDHHQIGRNSFRFAKMSMRGPIRRLLVQNLLLNRTDAQTEVPLDL